MRTDLVISRFDANSSTDLVLDLTIWNDFHGNDCHATYGRLRYQHSDGLLNAAADRKIDKYATGYADSQGMVFMPAVLSTSGRIHDELLRLVYLITHRQAVAYIEATRRGSGQRGSESLLSQRRDLYFNHHGATFALAPAEAVA